MVGTMPNFSSEPDKRHFQRIAFSARAILRCGERENVVRLFDISLRGALVALPADCPLYPGLAAHLDIVMNDGATHITMDTEVVHIQSDHAGLHCRHIDLDSIAHLRRLMELNLGDPALLDRDLHALSAGY